MIQRELRASGFEELLSSGIVLTGAAPAWRAWWNSAKKCSTCRCVWVFPTTAVDSPKLSQPALSTGVGLLISALEQKKRDEHARLQTANIKGIF